MDHYYDINLLPDPEFPATLLMNAIYSKLHKALCDLDAKNIGISFPHYKKTLGYVLRIHGTYTALQVLQKQNWIGGMVGYCNVSEVMGVPDIIGYRTISRKQPNLSNAKLRRLKKREAIDEEQAKNYCEKMESDIIKEPFLQLNSASNGQKHRRYIVMGELSEKPVNGEFDQFGLSKTATIPWFE